jgi:hypothetical protein
MGSTPIAATGLSSEGDESVNAAEGQDVASNIVAPATAASAPPGTMRESILSSVSDKICAITRSRP